MKSKKAKSSPDATIYLTSDGTRVMLTKSKQFPIHPNDPEWAKEMRRKSNERECVVRVSDGHELWGYTRENLVPERS